MMGLVTKKEILRAQTRGETARPTHADAEQQKRPPLEGSVFVDS